MESALGIDLGRVKVHSGPGADSLSKAVGALAFTRGADIYFRSGALNSSSSELLAHELVHVAQQDFGAGRSSSVQRQATDTRMNNPDVKKVYGKYATMPYSVDTYDKDWHLYVKERPSVKQAFEEEGKRVGVSPSELFVTAMGEGLGLLFDEGRDESSEVSGFRYMGTDHFAGEFAKYKKYAPANFNEGDEFRQVIRKNEKQELVKSAVFRNLRVAISGVAAVYRYHRQVAVDYGSALHYGTPTPTQLHFWSYYFFQRPNGAKPILQKNGSWDFMAIKFDKKSPHPEGIASKCYKRVATWEYIKAQGVFTK
jgi:hypothetical protein